LKDVIGENKMVYIYEAQMQTVILVVICHTLNRLLAPQTIKTI